jgi:hypothetical protein
MIQAEKMRQPIEAMARSKVEEKGKKIEKNDIMKKITIVPIK